MESKLRIKMFARRDRPEISPPPFRDEREEEWAPQETTPTKKCAGGKREDRGPEKGRGSRFVNIHISERVIGNKVGPHPPRTYSKTGKPDLPDKESSEN